MKSVADRRSSHLLGRWCVPVLAAFISSLSGCHDEVVISGHVTVPVEVQRLFSKEQPGSVEVMGSKAGANTHIRYLCDATDQPLILPYTIRSYGCAVEQAVEGNVFRVTPMFLSQVRCGEPGGASGGGKGQELAHATAPVFVGKTGCDSGEASVDLVLQVK